MKVRIISILFLPIVFFSYAQECAYKAIKKYENGSYYEAFDILNSCEYGSLTDTSKLYFAFVSYEVKRFDVTYKILKDKELLKFKDEINVLTYYVEVETDTLKALTNLSKNKKCSDCMFIVGEYYYMVGNFIKAKSFFEYSIQSDSTHIDSYEYLMEVMLINGSDIKRLLKSYKKHFGIMNELNYYSGMDLFYRNEYDSCIVVLSEYIKSETNDIEDATYFLGMCYWEKGELSKAELLFNQVSDYKSKIMLILINIQRERRSKAIRELINILPAIDQNTIIEILKFYNLKENSIENSHYLKMIKDSGEMVEEYLNNYSFE